jgi:hypothetical protein
MHFSDWLPTFLGFAGLSSEEISKIGTENGWDGMDIGPSIRAGATSWREGPRKSVLCKRELQLEMMMMCSGGFYLCSMGHILVILYHVGTVCAYCVYMWTCILFCYTSVFMCIYNNIYMMCV